MGNETSSNPRIEKKKLEQQSFSKPTFFPSDFKNLPNGVLVTICGRIIYRRDFGSLIFFRITDINESLQISISKGLNDMEKTKITEEEKLANFSFAEENLDMGDIVSATGFIYYTKSNEQTIGCYKIELLTKSICGLPEKWEGLQDPEKKIRYRFIDLISNNELKSVFQKRMTIISTIRKFFEKLGFVEVETPILQLIASGANADSFKTYYNSLDSEFHLRCAPELFLKRLIISGYTKVFEIGKCFRNEGIDKTHLQEFTMLEAYQAYSDYSQLQDLCESLVCTLIASVSHTMHIGGVDFSVVKRMSFSSLISKYTDGLITEKDFFDNDSNRNKVRKFLSNKGFDHSKIFSLKSLLELVYKKICLPNLIGLHLIYNYPASSLAESIPTNDFLGQQCQIIMGTEKFGVMEIVKAYKELKDSDKMEQNFKKENMLMQEGESETVKYDAEFVRALEYGMPPTIGLGLGIDRLVTFLTESDSIKDVIFFPHLRKL